ncbi:uncharacterized protein LOC133901979 [Phragmites australis]|uniref:uncharacterized protein LOC133901979 n=1 Tax=Phragmites australis TaxID=29695 RepID=UPI002D774100|nr:uncharacterized protein LOC133901979 [Phragmites australis]
MPLRPTASHAAAPTGSASKPPLPHFIVLCLAMGVALHAEPLLAAAAELHLHPSVVACLVLSVTALFHGAILSLEFLVARRLAEGETKMVFRTTASAATAPTCSVLKPRLSHFVVLCLAMGAALNAEPLKAAAAELHIHPGVVAFVFFSVAAFFHCAILSLNILVARRPPEREPKMPLRPAAPAALGSSHLARSAFLILAALMSASWFVEPLAGAAAELQLPSAAVVVTVVFFAALFNVSIHNFRSFFQPRTLPAGAGAAAQFEGFGAITAAVVGMGVAACLVAAGGSAYVYAPAISVS